MQCDYRINDFESCWLVINVDYASVIQIVDRDEVCCCKCTFVIFLHCVSIVATFISTCSLSINDANVYVATLLMSKKNPSQATKTGVYKYETPVVHYLFIKVFPPIFHAFGL